MLSLSNTLSCLRAPLAFAFLVDSAAVRLIAVFLAMCTDCLDGYLARKRHTTSQLGAVLDPLMDKFFVFFALTILFREGRLELWQALSMVSRDFFLIMFALYLSYSHLWRNYKYRSILWGKISTSMQFVVLMGIALGMQIPTGVFALFIFAGSFAFVELLKAKTS